MCPPKKAAAGRRASSPGGLSSRQRPRATPTVLALTPLPRWVGAVQWPQERDGASLRLDPDSHAGGGPGVSLLSPSRKRKAASAEAYTDPSFWLGGKPWPRASAPRAGPLGAGLAPPNS